MRGKLYLTILTAYLFAACAAPEEPAALKSNKGTTLNSKENAKASALPVNYGGAEIGDAEMKSTVKKCLDQGKFFDRTSGTTGACTNFKLAEVSCTDATISSVLDASDKSAYEALKSSTLSGYTLDQCLDCSSPVGNSFCEGSKDEKVKDPGTRLFHVKVNGSVVDIKTVYVYK